ncbi:MAG: hypothetical protein ACO1QB_08845 [Verrucomicrobiales bacterium]
MIAKFFANAMSLKRALFCVVLFVQFLVQPCFGFSLLGPPESWQVQYLGYNSYGTDVGAPKNLGEEYRWNVPIITYSVDRSFYDFFGDEGVSAIQQAFQILNDLPSASEMDLASFPLDTRRINPRASVTNLIDLKSTALSLMLAPLGLAQPEQFVWTLRDRKTHYDPFGGYSTNYLVVQRNFDPFTYQPSSFVNGTRYTYNIFESHATSYSDAVEQPVNSQGSGVLPFSSVAGFIKNNGSYPSYGSFVTGLTQDDAGGLRYLLNPQNINYEPLQTGVDPATGNQGEPASNFVSAALRPGRNKLKFMYIDWSWESTPQWTLRSSWTDFYYLENALKKQEVKKVQSRPDIVFSAADLGTQANSVLPILHHVSEINWHRQQDNNMTGPGIVNGGVTITFAKLTKALVNRFPGAVNENGGDLFVLLPRWGSFDHTTVAPVVYPQPLFKHVELVLQRYGLSQSNVVLTLRMASQVDYQVETSPDLQQWVPSETRLTIENNYSAVMQISSEARYFRVTSSGPSR